MNIETPVATVGIRGGIALVEVEPKTGATTATFVYGNTMTVTSAGGIVRELNKIGQMVRVSDGLSAPSEPVQIDPAMLREKLQKLEISPGQTGGLTQEVNNNAASGVGAGVGGGAAAAGVGGIGAQIGAQGGGVMNAQQVASLMNSGQNPQQLSQVLGGAQNVQMTPQQLQALMNAMGHGSGQGGNYGGGAPAGVTQAMQQAAQQQQQLPPPQGHGSGGPPD